MKHEKTAFDEHITEMMTESMEQALLDSLPCIALVMRPLTKEILASNRLAREFGLIPPLAGKNNCFWRMEPDGIVDRSESRYEADVDGVLWEITWVPFQDDCYVVYAVDITERRKAETVHRNTIARLESYHKLFLQMPEAAFIVSPEGTILDINDAATRQLGYKKPELIGKPVSILYDEESPACYDASSQTAFVTNREMTIRTKDQLRRTVLLNTSPVCEADGKVIHTVSLQNDITDIKRHDQEQQRCVKLESLGQLAGGIAHDFNNLLGGIYGYIDLAGAKSSDERVVKYLSKAINTIERAKSLTRQLLTFAKGGAPVKRVDRLFPFVSDRATAVVNGEQFVIKSQTAPDLWLCECDRNQIGIVVDHLIENAMQAMPEGGDIDIAAVNVLLEEKEHPTLQKGSYVRIAIGDHGNGIPQAMLPHLFDPFYSTKPGSRGLGLATSYSIVNRHGGSIDVQSEIGHGTVFTIYLPAVIGNVAGLTIDKPSNFRGSGTVVVVDDEEIMRETISGMLQSMGYTVAALPEGREAIMYVSSLLARHEPVAAMIFDLTIPGGMGGRETVEHVRKMYPSIPVFVSSGYADDPVMANPGRYGFTDSIAKPFRKNELVKIFEKNQPIVD